jgi:hypothetical protein
MPPNCVYYGGEYEPLYYAIMMSFNGRFRPYSWIQVVDQLLAKSPGADARKIIARLLTDGLTYTLNVPFGYDCLLQRFITLACIHAPELLTSLLIRSFEPKRTFAVIKATASMLKQHNEAFGLSESDRDMIHKSLWIALLKQNCTYPSARKHIKLCLELIPQVPQLILDYVEDRIDLDFSPNVSTVVMRRLLKLGDKPKEAKTKD